MTHSLKPLAVKAYKLIIDCTLSPEEQRTMRDDWNFAWDSIGETPPLLFILQPGIDIQPLDPADVPETNIPEPVAIKFREFL